MAKDLTKADCYDIYKDLLTEKQQETMEMYYFSDLSLGEISEETGNTRQAAFNCIKKCEERLEELESALGLLSKRSKGEKLLQKLKDCIEEGRKQEAENILEELRELI
ncbi:MAG: hypothetical protein NC203_11160 [Firmicutes bacterium]|nr:DNA-binding protein [[Eubacterium] siraeum]MCM1488913.1 hypothetical protein [Bacillota bacterium]